jgi:hypothetical protein
VTAGVGGERANGRTVRWVSAIPSLDLLSDRYPRMN